MLRSNVEQFDQFLISSFLGFFLPEAYLPLNVFHNYQESLCS